MTKSPLESEEMLEHTRRSLAEKALHVSDEQQALLLKLSDVGHAAIDPDDPDLILTLECSLSRVLDLTVADLYPELGTSHDELVSAGPSRFILNARKKLTPTQQLDTACFRSERISAVKVPSAQNEKGFCLDILIESLVVGERVAILDKSGRLKAEVTGWIPKPALP